MRNFGHDFELRNSCKLGGDPCNRGDKLTGGSDCMPEDDAPSPTDIAASADGNEDELEDLATLDVDATVDEVMTAVHWIEDHTPGLGADPQPAPPAPRCATSGQSPHDGWEAGSAITPPIPSLITQTGPAPNGLLAQPRNKHRRFAQAAAQSWAEGAAEP